MFENRVLRTDFDLSDRKRPTLEKTAQLVVRYAVSRMTLCWSYAPCNEQMANACVHNSDGTTGKAIRDLCIDGG
jgi:hypothetical protein